MEPVDDEGVYITDVWQTPWRIARATFTDVVHFLYCVSWSKLVAFNLLDDTGTDGDRTVGSVDRGVDSSNNAGLPVQKVSLRQDPLGCVFAMGTSSIVVKKGRGSSVIFYRSDPLVDSMKGCFHVEAVKGNRVSFPFGTRFQEEAFDGVWFMEFVTNPNSISGPLSAIYAFSSEESIWRDLFLPVGNSDVAAIGTRNKVVCDVTYLKNLGSWCKAVGLNSSQCEAVCKSVLHHGLLVQGPPGTGKTKTSAHLCVAHKALGERILCCAQSNDAADVLGAYLVEQGMSIWRYGSEGSITDKYTGGSSEYCLEGQACTLLRNEGYGPSNAWQKHLTKRIAGLLADSSRLMVGTIASASGRAPVQALQYDTVLVDEATMATEPDVLQVVLKAQKHLILVGDHCQLGPYCIQSFITSQRVEEKSF